MVLIKFSTVDGAAGPVVREKAAHPDGQAVK
jgi:hypothetical protein